MCLLPSISPEQGQQESAEMSNERTEKRLADFEDAVCLDGVDGKSLPFAGFEGVFPELRVLSRLVDSLPDSADFGKGGRRRETLLDVDLLCKFSADSKVVHDWLAVA